MDIQNRLKELADEDYASLQVKLVPAINADRVLGVRVPAVRTLAGELVKAGKYGDFLEELPHRYFDEDMLHGLILSELKDYDECVTGLDRFLPYVDNWAVCDTMSPKCFKRNRERLIHDIYRWSAGEAVYTSRFGIGMLMKHFLDDAFQSEYLELAASVRLEDYYSKMMTAWFFATALAKQWEATIPYLENRILEPWTHNKTIQKARESFRIADEQKAYLKTLKR